MSEHSIHLITELQTSDNLRKYLMQIREDSRRMDQRNAIANMAACSGLVAISGWFVWRICGRPQDRSASTIAAALCNVCALYVVADNALVTRGYLRRQYTTVPHYFTQ